jgi:hypothetical protein
MPVSIRIADAAFTKYVATALPPYYASASGYFIAGVDLATTTFNRLPDKFTTGSAINSPTYQPTYVVTTAANGVNTGVSTGDEYTWCGVVRATANSVLLGRSTAYGCIGFGTTSYYIMYAASSRGAHTASGAAWVFVAATNNGLSGGSGGGIIGTGNGTWSSTAYSYDATAQPAANFNMGGLGGTNGSDIAMSICYSTALSSVQIGDIYDWAKLTMAERGIAIL